MSKKNRIFKPRLIFAIGLALASITMIANPSLAQDAGISIPGDYKNSIGIGAGGGFSYNNDSQNFSATLSYERSISGPWGIVAGVGYDASTRKEKGKTKDNQSVGFQMGITYDLTDAIQITAGAQKDLIDKDEGEDWKSSGGGDWAVGGGISYTWPINDRVSIGPGATPGYGFENEEWRTEIELNIGLGF